MLQVDDLKRWRKIASRLNELIIEAPDDLRSKFFKILDPNLKPDMKFSYFILDNSEERIQNNTNNIFVSFRTPQEIGRIHPLIVRAA